MAPALKRRGPGRGSCRRKGHRQQSTFQSVPGVWRQTSLLSALTKYREGNRECVNAGKEIQQRPKVSKCLFLYPFHAELQEQIQQQPHTDLGFQEFSRKCSQQWRSLSKHEKAKYEAMARLDKARYQQEMMTFGGKRRRRRRDPQAPRKPPSSFILFSQDHYAQMKRENPNWSVVQVAKAIGQMWSEATSAEKRPYQQRASVLRAKYFEDRDTYRQQCRGRRRRFQRSARTQRANVRK